MTERIETTFKTKLSAVSGGKWYQSNDFCIVNNAGVVRVYDDLMGQRSNLKGHRDDF